MIEKKNINKFYLLFLFSHVAVWTLIPSLTNLNLPLDTIEALAWSSDLKWGYSKHPPFSALAVEIFYQFFGRQDWAYYFLSQIFVVISFIIIFKLAEEFFNNKNLAFLSVLLLEGIYFYNFTSPEFNVNISQLPFWSLSIYFAWRCIKNDKFFDYVILGISISLGILSKYLFLFLVLGIKFLFIYLIYKKKIKSLNFLITSFIVLVFVLPHLFWLVENEFATLTYSFKRTGGIGNFSDHIVFPFLFLIKQIAILIPTFIMAIFLIKKLKFKKLVKNEKLVFLFFTCIIPFLGIFFTSLLFGIKIRTMWMTPFYLLTGIFLIEIFNKNLNLNNLKRFYATFFFFFILSPMGYLIISETNEFKRTDYPGKEIARLVQNKWDDNFKNDIKLVVGDEWFAGNLSYHLPSRPIWTSELKNKLKDLNDNDGIVYTGNPKVLKNICPGVYGTIKPVGYCMIGVR